jgi:hypothetical protein
MEWYDPRRVMARNSNLVIATNSTAKVLTSGKSPVYTFHLALK